MRNIIVILLVVVTLQGCKKQEENLIIKNYPGSSELIFNDIKTNRFRVQAERISDKF